MNKKVITKYVTKNQLMTDYVTKREFADFKSDMHDFRAETGERLNGIDKRLGSLERKFDEFKDEIRIQMGAYQDQLRSDFVACIEYLKDIAAGAKQASDPMPF